MDICKMCTYHLEDEDGDIYCNQNCNEYLEFVVLPIYEVAPKMYEALKTIGQCCLVTEYSAEYRLELIEYTVNKIFAQIGMKNILNMLSEGRTPELMTALDELGIPTKEGDNLRSMADIMNDLSSKWQELEGRQL